MSDQDRRDYRSLGEILTDAREQRGWSVEDLAERTKITPRQIHALESDDLASLNGPVYARGFLRNLCVLYDLDREWLTSKLEASLESVGESAIDSTPAKAFMMPRSTASSLPEEVVDAENPVETTWTIETVDNSRVRRMRAPRRSGRSKWVWIVAALILASVAVLWAVTSLRSKNPSDPESAAELSGTLIPSQPDPQLEMVAEAVVEEPEESEESEESTVGERTTEFAAPEASVDRASTANSDPSIVASSGTRVGDQERVPYDDSSKDGIPSVLRTDEADRREMTLRLRAIGLVTVRAGYDGGKKETRQMRNGQSWVLRAFDHFAIEFSDVDAVVVEVDGVRREAPRGLRNEWIIYPLSTPSTPE